jgi:hypothetical protein
MKPASASARAAFGLLCALAACSHESAPSADSNAKAQSAAGGPAAASRASGTSGWIANGASACERYLTPDFVGRIFAKTEGRAKRLSGQACSYDTPEGSSIGITLIAGDRGNFDTDPNTQGAAAVGGIGDKAVRTASGIEAFTDGKGICQIDVLPPFGNKLSGDALARTVGEVCNALFALP